MIAIDTLEEAQAGHAVGILRPFLQADQPLLTDTGHLFFGEKGIAHHIGKHLQHLRKIFAQAGSAEIGKVVVTACA